MQRPAQQRNIPKGWEAMWTTPIACAITFNRNLEKGEQFYLIRNKTTSQPHRMDSERFTSMLKDFCSKVDNGQKTMSYDLFRANFA